MGEERVPAGDDAPHGVALVGVRGEPDRQPGEGEMGTGPGGGDGRVETVVVDPGQDVGAGRVGPHPLAVVVAELVLLLQRQQRFRRVLHSSPVIEGVVHGDGFLVETGFEEGDAVAAAGAPLGGEPHPRTPPRRHGHGPLRGDGDVIDDRIVDPEDVGDERGDDRGRDPGGAEVHVDLPRGQVGRDHRGERSDVAGEPGTVVSGGGGCGGGVFGADVTGQVGLGGLPPAGCRVLEHPAAEPVDGVGGSDGEEFGDPVDVDAAAFVQHDRQRVNRIVDGDDRSGGGDHPTGEDRRFGGGGGFVVVVLQGETEREVGVASEPAHRRGATPPADLPGLVIDHRRQRRAGDRAVHPDIGVIPPVQQPARRREFAAVGRGCRLQPQDRDDRVAHGDEGADLDGLGLEPQYQRHEPTVDRSHDRAVDQLERTVLHPHRHHQLPTTRRRHPGGDRGRGCGGGEPELVGVTDRVVDRDPQGVEDRGVGGWVDHELTVAVHPAPDPRFADDPVRMIREPLVHRHHPTVHRDIHHLGPVTGVTGRLSGWAAAEHDEISHHRCPGGGVVGAGGETDRTHEITGLGHRVAPCASGGVEAVQRGDHRHDPARPGDPGGFRDRVVVQREPGPVVDRIERGVRGERDVPDRRVEPAVREPGCLQRLPPHEHARVQQLCDRGGGRVDLHTGQREPCRVRARPEEHPGPAARFQHPPGLDPEPVDEPPNLSRVAGIGVMRVQRRCPSPPPLHVRQHRPHPRRDRSPLPVRYIGEHVRERTPPHEPGQQVPLTVVRDPAVLLERGEQFERCDVAEGSGV